MKSNKLTVLSYFLIIIGFVMLLWVSTEIRNYVIPNTGLMFKEVLKDARQTVKPQMWIGIILFTIGYFLTYFTNKKL